MFQDRRNGAIRVGHETLRTVGAHIGAVLPPARIGDEFHTREQDAQLGKVGFLRLCQRGIVSGIRAHVIVAKLGNPAEEIEGVRIFLAGLATVEQREDLGGGALGVAQRGGGLVLAFRRLQMQLG